jgi:hypothetical protein
LLVPNAFLPDIEMALILDDSAAVNSLLDANLLRAIRARDELVLSTTPTNKAALFQASCCILEIPSINALMIGFVATLETPR